MKFCRECKKEINPKSVAQYYCDECLKTPTDVNKGVILCKYCGVTAVVPSQATNMLICEVCQRVQKED